MDGSRKTPLRLLHLSVRTRILGVIPARFASSRFLGKALALLAGKPMLLHVYERASTSRYLYHVLNSHRYARIFSDSIIRLCEAKVKEPTANARELPPWLGLQGRRTQADLNEAEAADATRGRCSGVF